MKKVIVLIVSLTSWGTVEVNAQTSSYTLNSAGGGASLSGKTYEWSVGEMTLVNTATASGLVVTQGILQPFFSTVGINDPKLDETMLSVFPNPTNSLVFIKPQLAPNTKLSFALYDITGRLFEERTLTLTQGNETQQIDFKPYAAGVYMLEVITTLNNHQYRNAFKIQNNN